MNKADIKAVLVNHGMNPTTEQIEHLAAWSVAMGRIVASARTGEPVLLDGDECLALTMAIGRLLFQEGQS